MSYKYYMTMGIIYIIIAFFLDWSKIMYGLFFIGIGDILFELQKIKKEK